MGLAGGEARGRGWEAEDFFFAGLAGVLLLGAAGALLVGEKLHTENARLAYGLARLPGALLVSGVFAAAAGRARSRVSRMTGLAMLSTSFYLTALAGMFAVFWLPVLLAGGFVQDDWMLLAAAAVRKGVLVHPWWAWNALDAVDGNFRPLPTVLYFGYMVRWFGLAPRAFLAGNFMVNLGATLVLFAVVRELGYSKVAAATAGLLFLSRSMLYEIVSWACAIGDGIVILLCGATALLILKANKREGWNAVALHGGAWGLFVLATLTKQSSYAAPLIVGLLLWLRPGQVLVMGRGRRLVTAVAGVGVYGGTAAAMFLHGKALLLAKNPYPLEFSWASLGRAFAYVTWYVGTMDFPGKLKAFNLLPPVIGAGVLLGGGFIMWRHRRLPGERPRDVMFCLLAAGAALSLFVLLGGTRVAAYYGSMAAFWASAALGILATRLGPVVHENAASRAACFGVCALVAVGFLDVRLKQTGLLPSGGYTWGTFGMDAERAEHTELRRDLLERPATRVLVLEDFPGYPSYYAGMALLDDPALDRIVVHTSGTGEWLGNDLGGRRPLDELSALRDPLAYNWTKVLTAEEAEGLGASGPVLTMQFQNGRIVVKEGLQSTVR